MVYLAHRPDEIVYLAFFLGGGGLGLGVDGWSGGVNGCVNESDLSWFWLPISDDIYDGGIGGIDGVRSMIVSNDTVFNVMHEH